MTKKEFIYEKGLVGKSTQTFPIGCIAIVAGDELPDAVIVGFSYASNKEQHPSYAKGRTIACGRADKAFERESQWKPSNRHLKIEKEEQPDFRRRKPSKSRRRFPNRLLYVVVPKTLSSFDCKTLETELLTFFSLQTVQKFWKSLSYKGVKYEVQSVPVSQGVS